jgi:site-specific recombinase XerD
MVEHPLQLKSAGPYQAIWESWLKDLSSVLLVSENGSSIRTLAWHQAKREHVVQFLQPRAGQKASHNPARSISEVTRRRYWRVLERVYSFALAQKWITENPASELSIEEKPAPSSQLGHVLSDPIWHALPSFFPSGESMYEIRDRAVLLLLYELALAPEEVRHLRPEDITFNGTDASQGPTPFSLHIQGKRANQSRTLLLSLGLSQALRRWLEWRSHSAKAASSEWLFVSNRGTALAVSVLFSAVSACVMAASRGASPGQEPKRVGPQVLRNTFIVHMLNRGHPEVEVIQFVGIKSPKGLRRLVQAVNARDHVQS